MKCYNVSAQFSSQKSNCDLTAPCIIHNTAGNQRQLYGKATLDKGEISNVCNCE